MPTIGDRILRRREELGVSVKAIAKACGVKPSAVYQWQQNRTVPTGPNLVSLANILQTYELWISKGSGPKVREIPTNTLNADESEMIEAYRLLSDDSQLSMRTTIISLAVQRRKKGRGGM